MPKPSVLSVRDMDIMIISTLRRVNILELCLVIMLMIRKLLRMSIFSLRLLALLRIHQSIPVHRLLMRSTCLLISDDVDEIVESNIPAVPSKLFEFSCADYGFMIMLAESYLLVSHMSFLP